MKKEIVRVLLAHIIATSIFTCGENAYNAFAEEMPKSISNESRKGLVNRKSIRNEVAEK